ncbi:hypothetical protein EVAR_103911_1 [Eumeta japonica]|uniref:Uncharacterized protein n=1 Tax=Eumeta variegata TaxID=151549 RepID=A0A4C2A846_EUMVA|nr:hypothetical protein EVAR_103911_1 [Eumeta japonica]
MVNFYSCKPQVYYVFYVIIKQNRLSVVPETTVTAENEDRFTLEEPQPNLYGEREIKLKVETEIEIKNETKSKSTVGSKLESRA